MTMTLTEFDKPRKQIKVERTSNNDKSKYKKPTYKSL